MAFVSFGSGTRGNNRVSGGRGGGRFREGGSPSAGRPSVLLKGRPVPDVPVPYGPALNL